MTARIAAEIRSTIEASVGRANAGIEDPARRLARAVCVYLRYALDEPGAAGKFNGPPVNCASRLSLPENPK
ncbi:MAG TPA: hypothetical protein VGH03_13700 [Caulobacteraceae bacterium]